MRRLLFAANWKMNLGPGEASEFARRFRSRFVPSPDRETWFFPAAVSLEAAAEGFRGFSNSLVGAQDIYWEPQGAFTGAISAGLARSAGASATLVGHSERRHRFGETDQDTARKIRAALAGDLLPVLCVGETLEQRQEGTTDAVVHRQLLAAVSGLSSADLNRITVAYEPVWAIGTGRNATPADAAQVHTGLRKILEGLGAGDTRVLYGGSVSQGNVESLLAEPEIDGVLVGGASLDPDAWVAICSCVVDSSHRRN